MFVHERLSPRKLESKLECCNNFEWPAKFHGIVKLTKLEDTETTGSIKTTTEEKKLLAENSMIWNRNQAQFKGTCF
jgi:hypothetical protein